MGASIDGVLKRYRMYGFHCAAATSVFATRLAGNLRRSDCK
jgi:hypothetical protein